MSFLQCLPLKGQTKAITSVTNWQSSSEPHGAESEQCGAQQTVGGDRGSRGARAVAEVTAAAPVCEAADGREHLLQPRVITVRVAQALADRLSPSFADGDAGVLVGALLDVLTAARVVGAFVTAQTEHCLDGPQQQQQ